MFFFDKNSGGFYCLGIHPTIPAGAVEITAERHSELMLGVSGGKVIVADMEGYPLLADPPPPPAKTWGDIRQERDALIAATDYTEFSRHLTEEQRTDALAWRDLLFNITDDFETPDDVVFPPAPEFLNV